MSDDRRLLVLQAAAIEQGGEWTTRRVQRLYRHLGYAAPLRRTARRDLAQLTLVDTDPARRHYTVRSST